MRSPRAPLAAALLASLLAMAGPADAIYIVTPLTLSPTDVEADVGDALQFDVAPHPDAEGASYAGRTLTVRYGYDPHEAAANEEPPSDPDGTVSSDDAPPEDASILRDAQTITLDDASKASFTWTVPAEVDDKNVWITLVDEQNESVANANVNVGDAPPRMYALMEGSQGDGAPVQTDAEAVQDDATNDVPAPGVLALAVGAGLVALALRRRA